jgi:hypothetical protein
MDAAALAQLVLSCCGPWANVHIDILLHHLFNVCLDIHMLMIRILIICLKYAKRMVFCTGQLFRLHYYMPVSPVKCVVDTHMVWTTFFVTEYTFPKSVQPVSTIRFKYENTRWALVYFVGSVMSMLGMYCASDLGDTDVVWHHDSHHWLSWEYPCLDLLICKFPIHEGPESNSS